jgi:hypothetical protein
VSLRKTIEVIIKLAEQGVIDRYAVAGAVGALNYIAPTLTEDLDVLISTTHFDHRQSGEAWRTFCIKADIENPLKLT